jgi:hypothetical protein
VRSSLELHLQDLLSLPLDQITTEAVENARAAYLGSTGTGALEGHPGPRGWVRRRASCS